MNSKPTFELYKQKLRYSSFATVNFHNTTTHKIGYKIIKKKEQKQRMCGRWLTIEGVDKGDTRSPLLEVTPKVVYVWNWNKIFGECQSFFATTHHYLYV